MVFQLSHKTERRWVLVLTRAAVIDFEIHSITPGDGGHAPIVHQERKDVLSELIVIAGEPCEFLATEAMMEQLIGKPLVEGYS